MLLPKGLPIDPRDNLERARLTELLKFAADNGVEIPRQFQDKAIVIRSILRQRGLTRIQVPFRVLGQPNVGQRVTDAVASQSANEIDAAADLMRQVMGTPPAPAPEPEAPRKGVAAIAELRKECKRRGIKTARTDKLADLRAKLNGKDAA